MGEPRVIKRYSNRKLYDTQSSRYVTLEQIADLIREGEDVRIVDNNSKEDLTSITLAQIIFEEEKKQKSFLPLTAMRNIIQQGGEAIQEAGARMRDVFRRGAGATRGGGAGRRGVSGGGGGEGGGGGNGAAAPTEAVPDGEESPDAR